VEDIDRIIPKGASKLFYDMLFDIARLKYVRQSQLKLINKTYTKVCATSRLMELVGLGYLENTYQDVFKPTSNLKKILKNYQIKTLPDPNGFGGINELNNTEVLIKALKLPSFKGLLYPRFPYAKPYLIPDAMLILGDEKRYKLIFLEVEAGKENWETYLETKRNNYLRLAREPLAYNYWIANCQYFNITPPPKESFSFSVWIIGKTKFDFGEGFLFMEDL